MMAGLPKEMIKMKKRWVETFKQGEWVELECVDGYVKTYHFSRYRGC